MKTTFKTLTKLIKEHKNVIIMAHKNIDLDAFGSAICLMKIIEDFKKEVCLCLNKYKLNTSIKKAMELLKTNNIDLNLVNKTNIKDYINSDTLLIILDTSKKELLEYDIILKHVKSVVILDHHVVTNKNIKNTTLSYINANLSSTGEIMVNYLKYLNKKIEPIIATVMLAGIEVDTNSYNSKTTEATYEAAAFLSSLGASNITKQEILKENKDDYFRREKFIENSYMVNGIMAVCVIEDTILNSEDLAIISEKLLTFNNVLAAFTISHLSGNVVGISARSIGKINVFKIMKELGGGGHMADAAVQIKDKSVSEVEEMLIQKIEVIK